MTIASTLLTLGSARKISYEMYIWSAPYTLLGVLSLGLLHASYLRAKFSACTHSSERWVMLAAHLRIGRVSFGAQELLLPVKQQAACHVSSPPIRLCSKVTALLTLLLSVQTDRYAEYPKLKELVERKDALIAARATPPTFLKVCMPLFWCFYFVHR